MNNSMKKIKRVDEREPELYKKQQDEIQKSILKEVKEKPRRDKELMDYAKKQQDDALKAYKNP